MAVTLLEYARRFGRLPDHYVQAIGSGTGAIAVWEGAQRLLNAGIGEALPMLHLAQNAPFAPIHDAWTRGKPIDPDANLAEQLRQIAEIEAPVLANRAPPYSVPGGVRDALASSRGFTYAVTNAEARIAGALFGEAEGISVEPAAAVAVAALIQALRLGRMTRADRVLLHVTGNSDDILRRGVQLCGIEPVARLRPDGMREATARRLRSKIGR